MGLLCYRYCINQVEKVCFECDHSMIKGRINDPAAENHLETVPHGFYRGTDRYGNKGLFEDFETSIGE